MRNEGNEAEPREVSARLDPDGQKFRCRSRHLVRRTKNVLPRLCVVNFLNKTLTEAQQGFSFCPDRIESIVP